LKGRWRSSFPWAGKQRLLSHVPYTSSFVVKFLFARRRIRPPVNEFTIRRFSPLFFPRNAHPFSLPRPSFTPFVPWFGFEALVAAPIWLPLSRSPPSSSTPPGTVFFAWPLQFFLEENVGELGVLFPLPCHDFLLRPPPHLFKHFSLGVRRSASSTETFRFSFFDELCTRGWLPSVFPCASPFPLAPPLQGL